MIVLLPVYQPGNRLPRLVTDLGSAVPQGRILVVDDGSDPAAERVLHSAEELGCTVLRHGVNRGKGVALRTGFRYARENWPGEVVVCADADGQHSVPDILRVARHAEQTGHSTLGVRRFEGRMPLRSKLGNKITYALFRAATGRPTRDTQTGLRAFPADTLGWLDTIPGEKFEYEMNTLLYAARTGRPVDEIPIDTTYLDDNASSHFGALTDSVRIYLPLLRSATARFSR